MKALSGEALVNDNTQQPAPARNLSFSALRVAACLGIVLLHTANVSEILNRESLTAGQSAFSLGIVYLMMWAVPAFLMVSGALLLNPVRQITLKKIFAQYIRRVGCALLACCILFRLFDLLMNGEPFTPMVVLDALYRMFTGQSWAHLWYLYLLLGLYLLLPFYCMIADACGEQMMRYLLLIYYIFLSILPVADAFGVSSAFEIQTAAIYPFYFFAGHALYSGKLKIDRKLAWALFFGGTLMIVLMMIARSRGSEELVKAYTQLLGSYASPAVVFQSVGLFALVIGQRKDVSSAQPAAPEDEKTGEAPDNTGRKLPSALIEAVELLDGAGFGIYLVHMVFLRLFLRYEGWNLFLTGEWSFFAFALGVFFLSAVLVTPLKKIPYVRAIL